MQQPSKGLAQSETFRLAIHTSIPQNRRHGALRRMTGATVLRTFAALNSKGGIGKTTLLANLGGLLADMGARTLLVDADPQPSLTKYFDIPFEAPQGLVEVIRLAFTWKLATSGTPVRPSCWPIWASRVMKESLTRDAGEPLRDDAHWRAVLRQHAEGVGMAGVWERARR